MKYKQSLVSLFLFCGTILIPNHVYALESVGPEYSYVIKLHTPDSRPLAPLASHIAKIFAFSTSPAFTNIYSFHSRLTMSELKQALTLQYDYIELDGMVAAQFTVTPLVAPNDPGYNGNPLDIDKQWGLVKAGFPDAWTQTRGSKQVVVAIVDTGLDMTHEDLRHGSYQEGYDFLKDAAIAPGTNVDDNGHGTLVGGIIGAETDNGIGIAGTNWNVTLLPIKALDATGEGKSSTVAEAIVWAADHGASIINLSLGGLGFAHDTVLANAISYAFNKNVVIVAAAGNDAATTGGNLDTDPVFPICDDNAQNMIIGVAATDSNDRKPDFSNYGKSCVDVSAPGKRIISTINHDPATGRAIANAYAYASGTSLAAPFVSGQAALLKAKFSEATNKQIRDRILSTADNIDTLSINECAGSSCRGLLGTGRINVPRSIAVEKLPNSISEGELVKNAATGLLYYINGGKKQLVSSFVQTQRFSNVEARIANEFELSIFPDGPYAEPLDGTLIKLATDNTVFYMSKGLRLPVTSQTFSLRGFAFTSVATLSFSEINSWLPGSFLAPPDGTLLRTTGNKTVYWVVDGVLHAIDYAFYTERGLQIFPVVYTSDNDIKSFAKGEAYIR